MYPLLLSMAAVMIGYGITLPVLALSVEELIQLRQSNVLSAGHYVGIITGLFPFMQLVFAPIWGKLSDQYNRKYIYIIGILGYGLSLVLFGMSRSLVMFFLARSIGGIFSAAVFATAAATVAELTSPQRRHRGMALLGSASGIGVLLGPAIGAFLYQVKPPFQIFADHVIVSNFTTPFLAAALITFLAAIIATLTPLTKKTHNNVGESKHKAYIGISANSSEGILARKSPILPFLILAGIVQFALAAFEGTFVLHASWYQKFTTWQIGLVFIICGAVMTGMQAFFVSRLAERFGQKPVMIIGLLFMGLGLVLLMFNFATVTLLGFVALFALGVSLSIPGVYTVISHRSSADSIGRDMGWMNAAVSLGQAAGPVFGGWLVDVQIHLPYLLIASLLFVVASWLYLSRNKLSM